jgi:hypothetical protein
MGTGSILLYHPAMLDGDRFIAEQLQPRLATNEAIVHTAYLEAASAADIMYGLRERAYWAALTPQRLLLIEAGVGAFKPILENKGVEVIERASIAGVHAQGGTLTIVLTDGRRFAFLAGRSPMHASGQAELIDELVARHGRGPAAAPIAKSVNLKKRTGIVMTVIGLGIAAIEHFFGN